MINIVSKYKFFLIFTVFLIISVSMLSQISTTNHNLSVTGPGTIKALGESEICLFCHTPHYSSRTPLWNRTLSGVTYTLYHSTTFDATAGQPDGNSLLCLSCHDGTIALGLTITRPFISFGTVTTMPTGASNLTTDLSDDHPISFEYSSALALIDGELKHPNNLSLGITLQDNKVQCTSCHDPHKATFSNFLVLPTTNSQLCVGCHSPHGWPTAGHNTNTRMTDKGCQYCHKAHTAPMSSRLLFKTTEEEVCFDCHNGGFGQRNLQSIFNRAYSHNVAANLGVHDPTETLPIENRHVECVDCHNVHMSDLSAAEAPFVKGKNKGVSGIDTDGNPILESIYTYQICYKCHGTSSWRPTSRTNRQIAQDNVMLEFDPTAVSYHPIEVAGVSNDVPSLTTPWTTTSILYCNDCHSTNAVGLPDGPHGSIYAPILFMNYSTEDYTNESQNAYALCYRCHSRTAVRNSPAFPHHDSHVWSNNAPCNACHDPHGISSTQGNPTNNSRLINFDIDIVSTFNGIRNFTDLGYRTGSCTLVCHGVIHNNRIY